MIYQLQQYLPQRRKYIFSYQEYLYTITRNARSENPITDDHGGAKHGCKEQEKFRGATVLELRFQP